MPPIFAKIWKFLKLPKQVQLFVMRLMQDQFLIGVAGVIFDQQGRILLMKHTYRQRDWSLPGGYIKAKEHPGEALEREVKEESNLIISADEEMKVSTDRESARIELCYVGTYIGGTFKPSAEVSEAKLFDFEKLPLLSKKQLYLIQQAREIKGLEQVKIKVKEQTVATNKSRNQLKKWLAALLVE
jgi:ADP-ribose pyrophosphatase YjhB (NUDIX family)